MFVAERVGSRRWDGHRWNGGREGSQMDRREGWATVDGRERDFSHPRWKGRRGDHRRKGLRDSSPCGREGWMVTDGRAASTWETGRLFQPASSHTEPGCYLLNTNATNCDIIEEKESGSRLFVGINYLVF